MIKLYLKQAWKLLRQNMLFSSMYILGTGMAIAMIMILVIIFYIKIAPIYPETNRMRTLVAKRAEVVYHKNKGSTSYSFSYQAVKDYFYPLQKAEAVTAVCLTDEEYPVVKKEGDKNAMPVQVKYTDAGFWKVFAFAFLDGNPYNEADFQSGLHVAVISESMAKKLFGTIHVAGRFFSFDYMEYKVCGVIRDVSYAMPATFADIWIPFTTRQDAFASDQWGEHLLGPMQVYMLAPSIKETDDLRKEVNEVLRKVNGSQQKFTFSIEGKPDLYWQSILREYGDGTLDWMILFKTFGTMILALLLVPAVNLAGMLSSRMEKRLSEIGVRKAFGAPNNELVKQILVENFMLTCLGGLVGLTLAYITVLLGRNWILRLFDTWPGMLPEGVDTFFTPTMLFNPFLLGGTFMVCMILNLLSAIIPLRRSLKKEIVYSLNDKNN